MVAGAAIGFKIRVTCENETLTISIALKEKKNKTKTIILKFIWNKKTIK